MRSRRSTSSRSCGACATTPSAASTRLALPTVPTVYTIEQVLADPIGLNSRLGTYTNFVNLLDLCALAVPASMHPHGTPFGITLLAQAGNDAALASLGRVFHADTGLPLGATGKPQPPLAPISNLPAAGEIAVAVVGAHLTGMPLNGELKSFRRAVPRADHDDAGLSPVSACPAPRRPSPGCCGSPPATAPPSTSRSGRCRWSNSAASSRRSRRRCRSARWRSPTAAA